jgi:uncharacterized protein (DUF885 family)
MTRPVDARTDTFVEEICALDPLTATYAGVPGHDHELPDLSPDGYAAREELTRRAIADVEALTPTDEREAVAREAFLERMGLEAEFTQAGLSRPMVSVIASAIHEIRETFDLMPTATEEDWRNIAARLAAVPDAVDGYRVTLAQEAAAGRVVAARQYVEVAAQIRNWTGQSGAVGDFFAGLVAGAPEPMHSELERAAAGASAAYADFGTFLETDLAPRGREKEAVGREHYALASRRYLGAVVDLEETYAWGWAELKRLETTWPRPRTGSCPAPPCGRRWRTWTPIRRPRSPARRRSATGCSSSPIAPSRRCRGCTSTSPSRSGGSSA